MAGCLGEKNFGELLSNLAKYFHDAIVSRAWGYLLHNHAHDYFVPSLVHEFYASFTLEDIDKHSGSIVLNWRGAQQIIDADLIMGITGIPRAPGAPNPLPLEEYLPIMGENCVKPAIGGIQGTSMYRNLYTVCRWVCSNVVGVSHISSFYEPTLHIAHVLMTHNHNFCMCTQLLRTIGQGKLKQHSHPNVSLPLPCLITQICARFMSSEDFAATAPERVSIATEHATRGYSHCLQADWTPAHFDENVPAVDPGQMTDDEFWGQPNPTDLEHFIDFSCEGMRRIWRRLDRLEGSSSRGSQTRKRRGER